MHEFLYFLFGQKREGDRSGKIIGTKVKIILYCTNVRRKYG